MHAKRVYWHTDRPAWAQHGARDRQQEQNLAHAAPCAQPCTAHLVSRRRWRVRACRVREDAAKSAKTKVGGC